MCLFQIAFKLFVVSYLPFMVYDLREPFNEGRQIGIRIQHLAFKCICHSGHPQGTQAFTDQEFLVSKGKIFIH